MPYRHFQIPSYGGETEAAMTQFLNQQRVLHHAVINVCESALEGCLVRQHFRLWPWPARSLPQD